MFSKRFSRFFIEQRKNDNKIDKTITAVPAT